jgi:hypothetical protein
MTCTSYSNKFFVNSKYIGLGEKLLYHPNTNIMTKQKAALIESSASLAGKKRRMCCKKTLKRRAG